MEQRASVESASAEPPRRVSPESVRTRLILLTLILLMTAIFVMVLLLVDSARLQRETSERQLVSTARTLALAVDSEIGRAEAVLQALAGADALRNGDLDAFDRQARAAIRGQDAWIMLQDATGAQVVNTRLPRGAALPAKEASGNFPTRWARLRREGRAISGLTRGVVYPGHILAIDILARPAPGREYDLAVIMKPIVISRLAARQNLPKGWYSGVLDADGEILARNVQPERAVGSKANPAVLASMGAGQEGVFESVSLDGEKTLAAYAHSRVTGWTVAVAMPRSEAGGYLSRSLLLLSFGCIALLAVGGGMSLWLARGAARAVETVVAAAERLGNGQVEPPTATGLREIDQISTALYGAARRLSAREQELRALNETLEARVQEQADKLIQAHKLEALGRMTGGIAHDFNNLLTAILGNLELLALRTADPKASRFVEHARAAAERGAKLTSQLLAFARKQRLAPEPVDVNRLIASMDGLFGGTLAGAVAVELDLDPSVPAALADRTQLELVILNLAINARDAMPEGGVVRIATDAVTVVEPPSRTEHPEPGHYVRISVADSGTGISPEVLEQVFEPFFTTKSPGAGSGLGLSQALGVIKQLGGGMAVDSAPGEGSRVSLFLPVSAAAPQLEAPPPPIEPEELRGLSVLLVDDDPQLRAAACAMLREIGCEVLEADSGRSALNLLRTDAAPTLAIVDYSMPGMTGVELARQLQARRPGLTVVLSSGYMDADPEIRDWSGPVLPKPYATADLMRVLKAHGRRPEAALLDGAAE